MTSAVAGLALLLMLSGSGLSLGWFGRPAREGPMNRARRRGRGGAPGTLIRGRRGG